MEDHWNEPEEEKAPGLELKDFVYAFARSRYWIVLLGALGLVGGALAAARIPNTYTSHAKLLLRVGTTEELTKEELAGAEVEKRNRNQTGPTIEDEIHLLSNEMIYRELADEFGPAKVVEPEDPRELDDEKTPAYKRFYHKLQAKLMGVEGPPPKVTQSKAARTLLQKTRLVTEPYANVITVFHTSTNAEKARELCDRLTEKYVEHHREQFSIEKYLPAYEDKVKSAHEALELEKTEFNAHVFECKLFDVEEDMGTLAADIQQRQDELFEARLALRDTDIKLDKKSQLLATIPKTEVEIKPAVMRQNEEYKGTLDAKQWLISQKATVRFDSSITEDQRQKQLAYYDEEIRAKDKELEGLEPLVVEVPEERTELPNEDYDDLSLEISNLEIEKQALEEKTASLEGKIDEQKKRLTDMQACRNTHGEYLEKIADLQQAFDKVNGEFQRLKALDQINIEGDTNLQIIEHASLPLDKVGPSRSKITAMGLFAGLMAGAFLAVLRQLMDGRLRYPHVVGRTLHVPLLGVVPDRRKAQALLNKAPRPEATSAG